MRPKKTLPEREKELQLLLATSPGRAELQDLESRYAAAGGGLRPGRASLITYLLVYEREHGLIGSEPDDGGGVERRPGRDR
jgi:hypothetical protein